MDRGVPTEEVLAEMRASDPVSYLVGTPKGRLARLEKQLVGKPWRKAKRGRRGQASEARGRPLCLRSERRSHQQGARDAAATTEMAVGALEEARGDGGLARGKADEARRGPMALDGSINGASFPRV
jgi:hypothetical protein